MRRDYPILEFDPTPKAIIEPAEYVKPMDVPEHCVLCFFHEVFDMLVESGRAKLIVNHSSNMGKHPLYEIDMDGKRLAAFHPGLGGPLAAGFLDEVIARGCRKFVACGSAGVLDRELAFGHLVVPTSAVRDEGTSYHYMAPSRAVDASPSAVAAIEQALKERNASYVLATTWTTDAVYRESPARIALRKAEGCLTVEMEAASMFAVAQFRKVELGQILYAGDDVSGEIWDSRRGHDRAPVHERLFWLAAHACLLI